MLARVARYQIDPERCDDAVRAFQEAGADLAKLGGMNAGWVLVDTESGTTMTVTLWENRASIDASETRAATARQRAVREADGEVQSVVVFDVVRDLGGA
jgi:heme-degrading monooxygenase HmoA